MRSPTSSNIIRTQKRLGKLTVISILQNTEHVVCLYVCYKKQCTGMVNQTVLYFEVIDGVQSLWVNFYSWKSFLLVIGR